MVIRNGTRIERGLLSSLVNGGNEESQTPSTVDDPLHTTLLSAHSSLTRHGKSKTVDELCVAGRQPPSFKLYARVMFGRVVKGALGFKTVKENSNVLDDSASPSSNEANE